MIPVEAKAGAAGLGLGFFIIPAGFIIRKRQKRKRAATKIQTNETISLSVRDS
jgi:hypothetical protein